MELNDYKQMIDVLTRGSIPMKMAENEALPYLRAIVEKQEDQIKELQAQRDEARKSERTAKRFMAGALFVAVLALLHDAWPEIMEFIGRMFGGN